MPGRIHLANASRLALEAQVRLATRPVPPSPLDEPPRARDRAAWLADERSRAGELIWITRDSLGSGESAAAELARAPIWGLLRSARREHSRRLRIIQLDARELDVSALLRALSIGSEPEIVLLGAVLLAPRLVRVAPAVRRRRRLDPNSG